MPAINIIANTIRYSVRFFGFFIYSLSIPFLVPTLLNVHCVSQKLFFTPIKLTEPSFRVLLFLRDSLGFQAQMSQNAAIRDLGVI
jgi:hypothetical protein